MKLPSIPQSWQEHDNRVKPYVWSHRAVSWTKSALGLFVAAWLVFRAGQPFSERLGNAIPNLFLRWVAFFGILALGWELVSLPFDYASYRIERSYGLSKQNVSSWIADKAKGLALGMVLGAIALGIVFFSLRVAPDSWWAVCCTLMVLFSIVLAQLAPVLLIPIFFKLKPMTEGPLKERLLKLCQGFGVEVKDVYHLGLGEKTEKGNAAFVGLGKTKRILIGDTLYEKFSADHVEAVFAHELGHQVNNDLWKGIFFSAFWIYLSFFAANALAQSWLPRRATTLMDPYGLLLFLILLTVVQLPVGIIQAAFSRHRERLADEFAATKIGVGGMLAEALEKLTLQNFSMFRPHPLMEFLQHSHPAPWRRITKLRA